MTASHREPQQERSRATRARLLDATFESLAEIGWSATSVAEVAERAGVSRGAAQHYFPTSRDLVVAAVDRMAEVRLAEVQRAAAHLAGSNRTTETVVNMLVNLYSGPLFGAAMQIWAAAAADESLSSRVLPLEESLARAALRAAMGLLGVDESNSGARDAVRVTLDLARGLGLADVLRLDAPRRRVIVRRYAQMLDAAIT